MATTSIHSIPLSFIKDSQCSHSFYSLLFSFFFLKSSPKHSKQKLKPLSLSIQKIPEIQQAKNKTTLSYFLTCSVSLRTKSPVPEQETELPSSTVTPTNCHRYSLLSNHSPIYKPWTAREPQEVKHRSISLLVCLCGFVCVWVCLCVDLSVWMCLCVGVFVFVWVFVHFSPRIRR